jgi:hypothetical protein
MKTFVMTILLVFFASQALAIDRYRSTAMTCNEVKATIQRDGAAIMQHESQISTGVLLYDRYVASRQFCQSAEVVRSAYVPSATGACPVLRCDDDDIEPARR